MFKHNKKGVVIAGFAGVGKTVLAKKYRNVIDVESSPYKYDYSSFEKIDYEKLKGEKSRIINKNYPQNYVKAVKNAIKKFDIVLVQLSDTALDIYNQNSIDIIVCYPDKNAFEKYYKERYVDRGNSKDWAQNVESYYYSFIENNLAKSDYEKIILNGNQTLEDALIEKGYTLILK